MFGLGKYVDDGGSLTKANEDNLKFAGVGGFAIHGLNGTLIIPVLALAFLILLLRRVRAGRGEKGPESWSAWSVLHVALGLFSHSVVVLVPLHGINAFAILTAALYAGWRTTPTITRLPTEAGPV